MKKRGILSRLFGATVSNIDGTEKREVKIGVIDQVTTPYTKTNALEPQFGIVTPMSLPQFDKVAETRNGLTEGFAYVQNIAGSMALLWVSGFHKNQNYVYCYGFDHDGNFSEEPRLYVISESNFIQAENTHIENVLHAYDRKLTSQALYANSGKDVKFMQGGFYAGVKGKKTFFVVKDNKDLTYDIITIDKNLKEVRSTIYFDKTARQLTKVQSGAYLKKLAVKRGFTRSDLSFGLDECKDLVLLGFNSSLIWFNGFWNQSVISRKEASGLLNNNYFIG